MTGGAWREQYNMSVKCYRQLEVWTHLMLSGRAGMLSQTTRDELIGLADRTSRMLSGLRYPLQSKLPH